MSLTTFAKSCKKSDNASPKWLADREGSRKKSLFCGKHYKTGCIYAIHYQLVRGSYDFLKSGDTSNVATPIYQKEGES